MNKNQLTPRIRMTMANEETFLKETTIYVATYTQLNQQQTEQVKSELLRIIGYPPNYKGFIFNFVEKGNLVQANASVDGELNVAIEH